MPRASRRPLVLGLRENLPQFLLLVAVNALVGGMIGQQQSTLPLVAKDIFGLTGDVYLFAYVAAFGVAKAGANYVAGALGDRYGRKPVLIAGWLFAIPVPLMLIWAPYWGWIIVANVFLGINQGLAWSTTVLMKIDLVGPRQRGLAMGLNEASGYGAVAVTSFLAGLLAAHFGLRPVPFLLGLAYTALALFLSTLVVRETRDHAGLEAGGSVAQEAVTDSRRIFARTTWSDPSLSSASQAGLVNNLNFGLSWGVFPLLFAGAGLGVARIAVLVALYPAVWGFGQLATGWLSDRWGRRPLVVGGMLLQAAALAVIAAAHGFGGWALGTCLLGVGTAMVYPVLLAIIGDVAHPAWRGRAIGIYRVWRDLGYVAGAAVSALFASTIDLAAAVWAAAVLSLISAAIVFLRMHETHPVERMRRPSHDGHRPPVPPGRRY